MKYKGKLYGRAGGRYFDTGHNAEEWDEMATALAQAVEKMEACKGILDDEYGTGFDGLYDSIDQCKEALKKAGVDL